MGVMRGAGTGQVALPSSRTYTARLCLRARRTHRRALCCSRQQSDENTPARAVVRGVLAPREPRAAGPAPHRKTRSGGPGGLRAKALGPRKGVGGRSRRGRCSRASGHRAAARHHASSASRLWPRAYMVPARGGRRSGRSRGGGKVKSKESKLWCVVGGVGGHGMRRSGRRQQVNGGPARVDARCWGSPGSIREVAALCRRARAPRGAAAGPLAHASGRAEKNRREGARGGWW